MSKKKKIPALRFPKFQNSGEWEEKKLGDCLSYLQPTPYLVESTNYSEDKGVPVLTAGKSFVLGYTDEEEGIFRDKLPIIIFDDFTTASQFVNFPFKVKSSAIKILLAQKKYDIKFVFESMQILRYEVGVHKRHWISVYSKKQIAIPSLPEQQKIASCLSSLDDLIDNHSEKLTLLEKHKKGLMQNLFPQEGQKVPELRFPEFQNDGEWEEKKLGEIAKYKNGKAHEKDIDDKGKYIVVNSKFISTEGERLKFSNAAYCLAKKGDILMVLSDVPNGRAIAKCFYVDEDDKYTVNQRICKISTSKKHNSYFIFYILNRNPYFLLFDDGVKQTNLKKQEVENFTLLLPSIEEQQKIADCLSSLDDLIDNHSEKLALLEKHKKGLMQKLFPREGQKVPELRFPEFQNDGEWEEKYVKEHFEVCSSKRVLQKNWKNEGIPFYRTRELVSLDKNELFGSDIYISEDLFIELSKKYGVPKAGDFLVSGVGTLGVLYQVKNDDKFYFKDGNVIWFKLGKGIKSDFFKYSFQTTFFQKQILGQSSASTVGTYTISNARETKFWKPLKDKEQQKIADCLSSLDNLITAEREKIKQLKQHKKGLMQGLFVN